MIALLVLGSLVVFILIVFLTYKYTMKVSSLMIDGKEEVKDMIVNTGRAPLSWVKARKKGDPGRKNESNGAA